MALPLLLLVVSQLLTYASCVKLRSKAPSGPPTFLLISSPTEKKVSYVQLNAISVSNGMSVAAPARALVDSGLSSPHGIALDRTGKNLFVTDLGQQMIVHYHIRPMQCGVDVVSTDPRCDNVTKGNYILGVIGVQTPIVQGVTSNWVTIDQDTGALMWTDQTTNSVNRLNKVAVKDLIAGVMKSSDTGRFTQRNLQALASAGKAASMGSESHQTLLNSLKSQIDLSITTLYQTGVSENVATPAGVAAGGGLVYWANRVQGDTKGTVAYGLSNPLDESSSSLSEESLKTKLAVRGTATAYGLALTANSIIFTDNSQYIYGARKDGGGVVTISQSMLSPRGLAWDGDGTMFVADFDKNAVKTFPCGKLASDMQMTHIVNIHNPWGLALLQPAQDWDLPANMRGAARGVSGCLWLPLCLLMTMFVMR